MAYFEIWQLPVGGWVITRKLKSNIFDQSPPLDVGIFCQYESFSIFFLKILAKSRLDLKIFQYIYEILIDPGILAKIDILPFVCSNFVVGSKGDTIWLDNLLTLISIWAKGTNELEGKNSRYIKKNWLLVYQKNNVTNSTFIIASAKMIKYHFFRNF